MFSALTFNLRFGLAPDDGPRNWFCRKEILPEFFSKNNADFMCFQEVNNFQADFLRKILPEYNVIGQRDNAPEFWQDNLIFFRKRWKCTRRDHFFLSHTPDIPSRFRDSRWPRQCTSGFFEWDNWRLVCVNTHFDFDAPVQARSARIIMDRLARMPADVPVILMGDFNASPPDAPCYRVFTEKIPIDGDTACTLKDDSCFRNVFSAPFPGTHHGFTGTLTGKNIDWILYRGLIWPTTDAEVLQQSVGGIWPSDHFPVRATFDWLTRGTISFSAF